MRPEALKLFANSSKDMSHEQQENLIGQWIVLTSPDRDMFRTFGTVCKIRSIENTSEYNCIYLESITGCRDGAIRIGEQWQTFNSTEDLNAIKDRLSM